MQKEAPAVHGRGHKKSTALSTQEEIYAGCLYQESNLNLTSLVIEGYYSFKDLGCISTLLAY